MKGFHCTDALLSIHSSVFKTSSNFLLKEFVMKGFHCTDALLSSYCTVSSKSDPLFKSISQEMHCNGVFPFSNSTLVDTTIAAV